MNDKKIPIIEIIRMMLFNVSLIEVKLNSLSPKEILTNNKAEKTNSIDAKAAMFTNLPNLLNKPNKPKIAGKKKDR